MRRNITKLGCLFTALLPLAALPAPALLGQEVQLQRGDLIELIVPGRSELGLRMILDEGGNVEIPVIGTVHLEGLTLSEAQDVILRRLREVYPSVRQVRLDLVGEEARRLIYVQGQVLRPGKYEFREAPNVWEAIREAGGATLEASLDAVRVVRAEEGQPRTSIINVQTAIDSGNLESLPSLKPGDTVIVPERSMRYQGTGAVNVIGAVLNPAPYMLTGDRRLVDAIIAAGGSTADADLSKVYIIRTLPSGGTMTFRVDFSRYLEEGDLRHNPVVRPNDTVSVHRGGVFRTILTDARFILAIFTAAVTTSAIILTR
jgi:polysaccharide export outer membrane protein